jgi:cyanophycinase-like exopeptidase
MADTTATPGPIALVGSGEFLPQMVAVDRALLQGRAARAAFLPTAAGQEGEASVRRWLDLGTRHYEGMGVTPVPVPVLQRADAEDPDLVARVTEVGLVYLSGGNPGYLADTLRDSSMWHAIEAAWMGGAALAGCSAGAMALTASAPDVRSGRMAPKAGLALLAHLAVLPHFDRMHQWDPTATDRTVDAHPGLAVVGIDEDTALVGGPHTWTVMGRGTVTVFVDGDRTVHGAGATVTLP